MNGSTAAKNSFPFVKIRELKLARVMLQLEFSDVTLDCTMH